MKAEPFLVGLRLEGKACAVIGSSAETAVRAHALLRSGADVWVISTHPDATVATLAQEGKVRLKQGNFAEADLDGVWLVVLTDQNEALARRIAAAADSKRILFCAIDQPSFGSYFHVAIARAGKLAIAISTGGYAPALARRLRHELERVLTAAGAADFVDRLAAMRTRTPKAERSRVLDEIVSRVSIRGTLDLPDI